MKKADKKIKNVLTALIDYTVNRRTICDKPLNAALRLCIHVFELH